jgi:hypothetical protein
MNARILAASALLIAQARFAAAGTTDGSCLEPWELENFQPVSPTHGQLVESSSYYPRTTVVMFLASW